MFTKSKSVTDFLFTTPSFLTGAGTVMNLAGNFYDFNGSSTPNMADRLAIRTDFNIVGDDLRASMNSIADVNEVLVAQ